MSEQAMSTSTTDQRVEQPRRRVRGVSAAAPASRVADNGGKGSRRTFTIGSWTVLIVFAVLLLIPSLWAIKTSLTDNGTSAIGAGPILKDWNLPLGSYTTLLSGGDIWNWYLASFVTATLTTFFAVAFSAMAAYAISRM